MDRYIDYDTRLAEGRLDERRRYADGERLARGLHAGRISLLTRWQQRRQPRPVAGLATLHAGGHPVPETAPRRCA